jgi:ABC-2 type transport system permease protein
MFSRLLSKLFGFFKRDLLEVCSYPMALGVDLFAALGSVFSFFFLSKIVGDNANKWLVDYGGDYFSFALVGLAFSNYLSCALSSFRDAIRYGQLTGTIEVMMATRTGIVEMMLYSSAYRFVWTTALMLVYFILGYILHSGSLRAANLPSAVLVFVLLMISLCSLGLMSAAFAMIFKKSDPFTWLVGAVSTTLAGVIYPVSMLPPWLRTFAETLPMTIGLDGLRRAILQGGSITALFPQVLGLMIWAVVLFPIAIMTLRSGLVVAKRYGVLPHY